MVEQKVTTDIHADLAGKPRPYSRAYVLCIWFVLLPGIYSIAQYLTHFAINNLIGLMVVIITCIILSHLLPRYIRRNVVGYYVYLNINRSNGGDRFTCLAHLKPLENYSCIIRLPMCGWFRRAAVIRVPANRTTNSGWQVKVLAPYPLCYPSLELMDDDKRKITSSDPEMIYHILSHPNVWRCLEEFKTYRRREREAIGSWLKLLQTLQESKDAMRSPYGEFVSAYAEAVLTRRFGARKDLAGDLGEIANVYYPDETAIWASIVDEHGYLLSAQGRRAHEAAKARQVS